MRIQHNIMAMNSYRNYNNNASALSKNLEKLSSGYKVNRAGDDAAGLAISEKMRAQIKGLEAAQKNVKDGINLVKTAEGAMQEIQDMLSRMKYLATQSSNGIYENEVDRENLQLEVEKLNKEIDRIADSANFNGIKMLNGDLGGREVTKAGGAAINPKGNSIKSIEINGGGTVSSKANKMSLAFTSQGKLTLKFTKAIASMGLKIQVKGPGMDDWTDYQTGAGVTANSTVKEQGGTYTFRIIANTKAAVFKDSKALDYNMEAYDGMKVTISIDAAKYSTGGKRNTFTAFSATKLSIAAEAKGLKLRIGDTADDFNELIVDVKDMHAEALGIGSIDIGTAAGADEAISKILKAINTVSSVRGELGATQNRLEHTANNLSVMTENITDAESGIRDTDVADEMMAYTKNNILIQSAQAMLAQANAVPQGVLQLLQ